MKKYILLLLLPILAFANIGKITAIKGDISIKRDSKIIAGSVGLDLKKHDFILSKKNSKAQIVFLDKTIFTIGQNSTLDIAEYLYDEKQPSKNKVQFNVLKGAFSTITGRIGKLNKSKFKLKTRSASIGIRGTIVKANQQVVMCTQGAISVTTPNGKVVYVNAGKKTDVSSGTPTPPTAIKKGDIEAIDIAKQEAIKPYIAEELQDEKNKQAVLDAPISWGTWASDLSSLGNPVQTDVSVLDNLRNSSSTVNAQYNGQVSGTTSNGGDIKIDGNNAVQINFALGGGQNTMDGTIKFNTTLNQAWDTAFSGTTSGNTFSSTNIDSTSITTNSGTTSVTDGSGNIDGSFYGSNTQAIGGTFNISAPNSNDGTATGIFKATK
ncbi:MAG: FecR domain-containing protein [Campylobacterota bacterium]|nr:FecR domain-containing protein [Campylobacterota bacterium]